ncbi:DNA translocase FtsK [Patescibacteria group bacterium]|nr:DNA translocase FtsK [Patescibacteria group bacterium]
MGRKKKEEKQVYLYKNIASIVTVFIGLIILFVLIQPQETSFKNFVLETFGLASFSLSLLLFVTGLYTNNFSKIKFINNRTILGFFILNISFLFLDSVQKNPSIIGGFIYTYSFSFIGFFGSIFLFLMFLTLSFYLIFNKKFIFGVNYLVFFIKNFKKPNFKKIKIGQTTKDANKETPTLINDVINQNFDETFNSTKEKSPSENTLQNLKDDSVKEKSSSMDYIQPISKPLEIINSKNRSTPEVNSTIDGVKGSNFKSNIRQNSIWEYPSLDLLNEPNLNVKPNAGNIEERKSIIEKTLKSFVINAKVVDAKIGPSVTQYVISVDEGTKTSKILSLQTNLALALASPNGQVRIEAPIPGLPYIGIEVPNESQQIVSIKPLMENLISKRDKSRLNLILGQGVNGNIMHYALNKMPHLLVAGTTGSGKSVMIHSILISILFNNSPDECKLVLIDPKRVELTNYKDIPHLLTPVIVEPQDAVSALRWVVSEMERRLRLLQDFGVKNIDGYNEKSGFCAMPFIVVVIDELADLMMTSANEVERYIVRIAQIARATGIHLIVATQRPSTNIITGTIKGNIAARMAFNVASGIDSRVIIDSYGAEKLMGKGDMLYVSPESSKPTRIQGAFVAEDELLRVVNFLKSSQVEPEYIKEILASSGEVSSKGKFGNNSNKETGDDPLFEEAVKTVLEYGRGSTSLLQRRLSVGYARAAKLMDLLEDRGVVSRQENSSRGRDVLIGSLDDLK